MTKKIKQLKIQIIGARALNPIQSTRVKKHASARFYAQGTALQIDAGNRWQGKADYLLITHLHADHAGKINTVPADVAIRVPDKSFRDFLTDKTSAPISIFPIGKKIRVGPFFITAFPVQHSSTTKTFGYRLEYKNTAIVWLPDFRNLHRRTKYFYHLDALFIGASCYSRPITHRDHGRHGHGPILTTLRTLERLRLRPKKIFLIHLGKQLAPLPAKQKTLAKLFPKFKLQMANDNQNIFL